MRRSSARTFRWSKIGFEFNYLGARISKHFILQIGERECLNEVDLSVIIWKRIPVDVCSDIEIGAHLPG